MHYSPCLLLTLLSSVLATSASAGNGSTNVTGLRCEYRANPLGIEAARPRLSWLIESDRRGARQVAYQVLAASSADLLANDHGDLWDSGKVASDQTIQVEYTGKQLVSRQHCYWKVRMWDSNSNGVPSAWSAPGNWSMGLFNFDDWQAVWIMAPLEVLHRDGRACPRRRRACRCFGPPSARRSRSAARLAICGVGQYEARINGTPVTDAVLEPGWTNYRDTCLYRVYDVSDKLAAGENVLGVMLGNGMYNVTVTGGSFARFTGSFGPLKVIARLDIDYADGTSAAVLSNESWRTAAGPITFSCVYGGEDYDARREQPGWDRPGFDASSWRTAEPWHGPGGRLSSQSGPPIKVMQEFKSIGFTQPKPGVFVYDLGQNFSGWPQLSVEGPAGTQVKLTPGELLDDHGLVSQRSSGGPVWFSYILKGNGVETWHPRFSYYGFRYLQVEGAMPTDATDAPRGLARLHRLAGQFVHSSADTVGQFDCSNPDVVRIHQLITAAIRSNLQSVLTDCPHREKLGWLEVSHLLAGGIACNFNIATFYTKICNDMRARNSPRAWCRISPRSIRFIPVPTAIRRNGVCLRHQPLDHLADLRRPAHPRKTLRRDETLCRLLEQPIPPTPLVVWSRRLVRHCARRLFRRSLETDLRGADGNGNLLSGYRGPAAGSRAVGP